LAVVPKESTVDCFCKSADWSPLVSQKSTSLVPTGGGGGGGGGVTLPPDDFLPHAKNNVIKERRMIVKNIFLGSISNKDLQ
jgi:hypothetical protein